MTWIEWVYYSAGLHRKKIREWEHTRAIAWMIYKSNADPKKSEKKMTNWWKLPTDGISKAQVKRPKGKILTKLQVQNFFNSNR